MENNLVSILMPVYNSYDHVRCEGKNLLETALKSILNQSYTNFELIILDNQSTDKTPIICKGYASKNSRVKCVRDTKKRYPEGAITHLASLATGDYCMIANDDDIWDKSYIATLVTYLEKHHDVDLCYANGQYIDIEGYGLGQLVASKKAVYSTQNSNYAHFIKFLHLRNVIPIAFGVYRTKAFRDTLPYRKFDTLKANVDNLFMMKFFLQNHRLHFIDRNLFFYRRKKRALDPSKVSDMPPLTHPVDIWNYYGVHQINLYLEILKLINKNVHHEPLKMFANVQSLTSCINTIENLLRWLKDEVAANTCDKNKFSRAIAFWKNHVPTPLEPIYERVQLNDPLELSGKSPIVNNEVANLKQKLITLKEIVKKLNYQNDNKYLELRKRFLGLIQKEFEKVSDISQKTRVDKRASRILFSPPKKAVYFKKRPKISVLVTSYNLNRFLKPTLYSILNQQYDAYEIIVIDGGSTDGSVKRLKRLSRMFPQLRCIFEKNGGYPDALWKGIKLARGEYLLQCAVSDAYANPDWLAICAKTLEMHKHISLVWGFPQYLDEQNTVGKISYPEFHTKTAPSEKEFFRYWLRTGFHFPEGNLCVRKKVLMKCYPATYEITSNTLDWLEFCYRFNRYGYLARHIPVVANYGRQHKSQMGLSLEKSGQLKKMSNNYFRKVIGYRIMLLTKISKHKFIDQDGHVINNSKRAESRFYQKSKTFLYQIIIPLIYRIKQVLSPVNKEGGHPIKKLHLGCGQIYLEGYANIDYPQVNQNVQKVKADLYQDITKLDYPIKSIDEIRLHHVFEHFDRPTALALLCRWREWLKPGGRLRIETPDVMASYKLMVSSRLNYSAKQQIIRHLYGSHEARWAVHQDGWYKEKYLYVLKKLGYENIRFKYNQWGYLRNIEVFAYRSDNNISSSEYQKRVRDILVLSTIKVNTEKINVPEGTEKTLLRYWLKIWRKVYQ